MNTTLKAITLGIFILTAPCPADAYQAKTPGSHHRIEPLGRQLGLGSPASLASTVRFVLPKFIASGYSLLVLQVNYTHANNGALTFTCKAMDNSGGSSEFEMTTCQVVAGTCNLQFAGVYVTPTLTGSKKFIVPVGILGYHDIACTISHGGTPTSSDTITVDAYLTAGSAQ